MTNKFIIIIKFRSIVIDLIVSSSKELIKNTKNNDSKLSQKENEFRKEADELIEKAKKASEQKIDVEEDWYKK